MDMDVAGQVTAQTRALSFCLEHLRQHSAQSSANMCQVSGVPPLSHAGSWYDVGDGGGLMLLGL